MSATVCCGVRTTAHGYTSCPLRHVSCGLLSTGRQQPQAFLLSAMKFHCYLRCLPGRGAEADPRLALGAVQAAITYMAQIVRGRTEMAGRRLGLVCR